MGKKQIAIDEAVYSSRFLRFAKFYAAWFKASGGYGNWLKEYQDMENRGMFKPEQVRAQFIKILEGKSQLPYLYKDAIHRIGLQALDAAKAYAGNKSGYSVTDALTGEPATDEDGDALIGLSLAEARQICDGMNEEAGMEAFIII